MDSIALDFRHAVRLLTKYPGFALVAVITLALGIGANTAMFSVINAVLLRPLPFHEPDQLLAVSTTDITRGNALKPVSYPTFLDWRSQNQTIESMSAWTVESFTLMGRNESINVTGVAASANLFSTLGIAPLKGRGFIEAEDQPDKLAVILSHHLWATQFASDPNILSRTLTLDGHSFSIIGVMPASFQFPIQNEPIDLWTTIAVDSFPGPQGPPFTAQRGISYLNVLARRKPDIAIQQVRADLDRIQRALNRAYPENRPRGIHVITEADDVVGDMRKPLLLLFGAVTLVLMIACANVANLLLSRFTARQKEFAMRSALGASRAAVLRQLIIESVLLSCVGGCVGLLLTFIVPAVVRLAPDQLNSVEPRPDLRVLWFTLLVSIAVGSLFGIVPVLFSRRREMLMGALNAGGRSGTGSVTSGRTRAAILFVQVALTTILLAGAGLLLQGLFRLAHTDPGFASDHVLTFGLSLPSRYAGIHRAEFYSQLLDHIRNLPAVRRASLVQGLPMGSTEHQITTSFELEGHPTTASEKPTAALHVNDVDYFRTMGIPLLSGRNFNARDDYKSPPVIIVNQAAVRRFFNGRNPIGQHLLLGVNVGRGNPNCEVVGIVGDLRSTALESDPVPELYVPVTQLPVANVTVVVRTSIDPESLVSEVRRQVSLLDRELPLRDVKTLDNYVDASIASPRFSTVLLGMFAVLSLMLTAIGLYGVVADSVAQRTREIGIRVAVGAQSRDIISLVIKNALFLAVSGAAVGLVGGLALKRVVGQWIDLQKLNTGDASVFLSVVFLLVATVLCASYIPVLRATRVDPVVALRQE